MPMWASQTTRLASPASEARNALQFAGWAVVKASARQSLGLRPCIRPRRRRRRRPGRPESASRRHPERGCGRASDRLGASPRPARRWHDRARRRPARTAPPSRRPAGRGLTRAARPCRDRTGGDGSGRGQPTKRAHSWIRSRPRAAPRRRRGRRTGTGVAPSAPRDAPDGARSARRSRARTPRAPAAQ